MSTETAQVHAHCPNGSCNREITIEQIWTAAGVNDYGGYVLECLACHTVFALHIGRDIHSSRVLDGATVIDAYDDELGDKANVLARNGIREV